MLREVPLEAHQLWLTMPTAMDLAEQRAATEKETPLQPMLTRSAANRASKVPIRGHSDAPPAWDEATDGDAMPFAELVQRYAVHIMIASLVGIILTVLGI